MLNHIVIMGRLTRDPELRYTQSNVPVASFTVAVDRDYQKDQVDFIDCVAWRQGGEFVSQYFRKGQMIVVSGSLQSRRWEDRDGNKRVNWEINVERSYFGEAKRREDGERSLGYARDDRGGREERYGGPSQSLRDSSPRSGASREYGNPNVSAGGFEEMGPGTGEGNPFTESQQVDMFGDGELPF